ncbi:putative sugar kinase [Candidatus Gugararchaeum adminiculabundum]|nr:putative sugar kinase [Candidatus Gugararchaeum adminiculabundum]
MYDVLGLGTAVVDYFAKCDDRELAKLGLVKGASNFYDNAIVQNLIEGISGKIFMKAAGDNARNVCEAVARLGGKPAYASMIGDDREGGFFESNLKEIGINSLLEKTGGKAGTGRIITFITPDLERTFVVNLGDTPSYSRILKKEIDGCKYFFCTSITTAWDTNIAKASVECMKYAGNHADNGVAYALESPPLIKKEKDKIMKIVEQHVDVLFCNRSELAALTGLNDPHAAIREIEDLVPNICVKLGKKGSILKDEIGDSYEQKVYPAKAVDTTGAGDFYAGGVLYALAQGKTLKEAGDIGSRIAAKKVEQFGARLDKSFKL